MEAATPQKVVDYHLYIPGDRRVTAVVAVMNLPPQFRVDNDAIATKQKEIEHDRKRFNAKTREMLEPLIVAKANLYGLRNPVTGHMLCSLNEVVSVATHPIDGGPTCLMVGHDVPGVKETMTLSFSTCISHGAAREDFGRQVAAAIGMTFQPTNVMTAGWPQKLVSIQIKEMLNKIKNRVKTMKRRIQQACEAGNREALTPTANEGAATTSATAIGTTVAPRAVARPATPTPTPTSATAIGTTVAPRAVARPATQKPTSATAIDTTVAPQAVARPATPTPTPTLTSATAIGTTVGPRAVARPATPTPTPTSATAIGTTVGPRARAAANTKTRLDDNNKTADAACVVTPPSKVRCHARCFTCTLTDLLHCLLTWFETSFCHCFLRRRATERKEPTGRGGRRQNQQRRRRHNGCRKNEVRLSRRHRRRKIGASSQRTTRQTLTKSTTGGLCFARGAVHLVDQGALQQPRKTST